MRRHELDVFSLVAGLVFAAVAVAHLVAAGSTHELDAGWVVPVVMVLIGVASLAGLVKGREPRPAEQPADDLATAVREDTDDTLVLRRDEPEAP